MSMRIFSVIILAISLTLCSNNIRADQVLRVGHFPNLTHAQALVAHQLSRQGQGWFEARIPDVKIEWFTYNAGPSAIEALLSEAIDLTYVGPNPALNAYARSGGEEIRILGASAIGGSALLIGKQSGIKTPQDFRGKKVGTPQLGNSQDIMTRAWLMDHGFKISQMGGEVTILPTANPDQLDLLERGELDAVWTVEPWASVLESKSGAVRFLEDSESLTTLIATSVGALSKRRELLKSFTKAAAELTTWINQNPAKAKELIQAELEIETTRRLPDEIMERAWSRIKFSSSLSLPMLEQAALAAHSSGFMKVKPELSGIVANLE